MIARVGTVLMLASLLVLPAPAAFMRQGTNPLHYTTTAQQVFPSAADGIAVTPNGTAFAASNWFEVTPSAAADLVMTGVAFTPAVTTTYALFQLGVGAAKAEVVIGSVETSVGTTQNSQGYLPFPVPLDAVPAGSRLSIRLVKNGTSTTNWKTAVTYMAKPLAGNLVVSSAVPQALVASSAITPVNVAYNNSNWSQQVASTTNPVIVTGLAYATPPVSVTGLEFDIGVGAAASEVVQTTIRTSNSAASLLGGQTSPRFGPLFAYIPAGSRVSLRMRKSGTSTAQWFVDIMTLENLSSLTDMTTAQRQKNLPSAADATNLPDGASTWQDGAWVEYSASLPTDIAITGLQVLSDVQYEVDVGHGSVGNEVVDTTFRGTSSSSSQGGDQWMPLPVSSPTIASGQRLALRTRLNNTSGTLTANVIYVESPDWYQRGYRQKAYPSAADNVAVTPSGTTWQSSNYSQLVSSTASGVLITGVTFNAAANAEWEADLATGPAASESVFTTIRSDYSGGGSRTQFIALPVPHFVPQGTRIAVRMRKIGTNTSNWGFAATYVEYSSTGGFAVPQILGMLAPQRQARSQAVALAK